MTKFKIYTIYLLIQFNLFSQNKCDFSIKTYYSGYCHNKEGCFFQDSIIIGFDSGFSDSCQIFINNILQFNGRLESNKSTGTTDFYMLTNRDIVNLNRIKIILFDKNKILDIPIEIDYPYLYFDLDRDNNWVLSYTDERRIYE